MSPWASGDSLNSTNLNNKFGLGTGFINIADSTYGADATGASDSAASIQAALTAGAGKTVFIPAGTFSCSTGLLIPSNTVLTGLGWDSVLSFAYTGSGTRYYVSNLTQTGSGNSNIQLRDFWIRRNSGGTRTTGSGKPGGIHLKQVTDFAISGVRVDHAPSISIAYQACQRGQIVNNYIRQGEADGITGYWGCSDIVIQGNTIYEVGDDGIGLNATSSDMTSTTTLPQRITIIGNTIYGQSQFTSPAAGRGIWMAGCRDITVHGNSIASTFASGIGMTGDEFSGSTVRNQRISLAGNNVYRAGRAGDGSQPGNGIRVSNCDYLTIMSNTVSECSDSGILISDSAGVAIAHNSVVSNGNVVTQFGIDCTSGSTCTDVAIRGNTVYQNSGGGIFLQQVVRAVVDGNTCINNGNSSGGTNNLSSGIICQGAGARGPSGIVTNNFCTDTRAAGAKTQRFGIANNNSGGTLLVAHNAVSGNSGVGMTFSGTLVAQVFGNTDFETSTAALGWMSPSAFTDGTTLAPGLGFASEQSLGLWRSAASTIKQSYGTFDLTATRLSVRTTATSLTSLTVGVGELAFFVGGTSGATLGLRSGSTLYLFASSSSTVG